MMRIVGCLLLLVLVAVGQDRSIVEFRLKKEPHAPRRGWAVEVTESGFRFERFGGGRRVLVTWENLIEEDARRLRLHFGLDRSEDEILGLIPGHRIYFRGGLVIEGVLVRVDDQRRHWIQSGGLLLPYAEDRIERVEKAKVKETDVYDENELYLRRLRESPPSTAKEHRDLADYSFDVGNFADAKRHYQTAIEKRPAWAVELRARLAEIDEYLVDAAIARELGRAKKRSRLDRDFDGAKALLEEFMVNHPDSSRAAARLLDQVETDRAIWLQGRFHRVKNEEFDRTVDRYLIRKAPTIDQAMAWARRGLADELEKRIKERMGLTDVEFDAFLESRPKGSPHWATYWSGSFVISKRAVKGKSSKKSTRGDPDRWWFSYADVHARGNFVRAYAAEKLPKLFEVVQVKQPPCDKCGGTGRIRHMSVRGLESLGGGSSGAGHEWNQRCPRCFGARVDRVVGYR